MRGKHFDPGQLRRELVLEEPARTADALGGVTESWSATATVWGLVESAARPGYRAGADESGITHRVTVRADERVQAGRRFRDGAGILAIRAVTDPDGTGRYFLCLTREENP
jgi:SPP1 family predicted phage head-tail adaptor